MIPRTMVPRLVRLRAILEVREAELARLGSWMEGSITPTRGCSERATGGLEGRRTRMRIRSLVCAAAAAAGNLQRSPLARTPRSPWASGSHSLRVGAFFFALLRVMSTVRGLVPHSAPCAAVWSCRRPAGLCERGAAEGHKARGVKQHARFWKAAFPRGAKPLAAFRTGFASTFVTATRDLGAYYLRSIKKHQTNGPAKYGARGGATRRPGAWCENFPWLGVR